MREAAGARQLRGHRLPACKCEQVGRRELSLADHLHTIHVKPHKFLRSEVQLTQQWKTGRVTWVHSAQKGCNRMRVELQGARHASHQVSHTNLSSQNRYDIGSIVLAGRQWSRPWRAARAAHVPRPAGPAWVANKGCMRFTAVHAQRAPVSLDSTARKEMPRMIHSCAAERLAGRARQSASQHSA